MDFGVACKDQPGYLVHFTPGAKPTHPGLTGLFLPLEGASGPRGVDADADANGLVWTAMSSGHLASFDRFRCKTPLKDLDTVTGKQCMEDWIL